MRHRFIRQRSEQWVQYYTKGTIRHCNGNTLHCAEAMEALSEFMLDKYGVCAEPVLALGYGVSLNTGHRITSALRYRGYPTVECSAKGKAQPCQATEQESSLNSMAKLQLYPHSSYYSATQLSSGVTHYDIVKQSA